MFDDLIDELRRYEHGHSIEVSLPTDEHGYLDRECPATDCRAEFRIFEQDSEKRDHNDSLFCPICKHEAPGDEYVTETQLEFAKEFAIAEFSRRIGKALDAGTRRFKSRRQRGFITMKLSYKPDAKPIRLPRLIRMFFTYKGGSLKYDKHYIEGTYGKKASIYQF